MSEQNSHAETAEKIAASLPWPRMTLVAAVQQATQEEHIKIIAAALAAAEQRGREARRDSPGFPDVAELYKDPPATDAGTPEGWLTREQIKARMFMVEPRCVDARLGDMALAAHALRERLAAAENELDRWKKLSPPVIVEGYPNLDAALRGCVSGSPSEWPAIRGEILKLAARAANPPAPGTGDAP